MSEPAYDAVIAGGGLSGLSLAAHLAVTGDWRNRRVLIIDDAAARPMAVCWGFWSATPGLLDAAVSHTYDRVAIHAAGSSRVLSLGRFRYRVVRRPDLVRVVRAMIDRHPGFELRSGRVERVHDGPDRAESTVDGSLLRSRWAFDGVSPQPSGPRDASLAFTGWEVHCDDATFDPRTPTLFDFRTPQRGGARFVYVLPDDPHRALVELTEFVPRRARPPSAADRRAALDAYLHDVVRGGDYRILRSESAVLALRTRPYRHRGRHVVAIGARGGLVKASTGYAYQRIQRDSAAIAESLRRHGHPFAVPTQRRRHRLLDAVLLEVLDRDPGQLEVAFARLFHRNPAERVLRFLDEDTGIGDELHLMASLPPVPYLRALAARMSPRIAS